MTRLSKAKFSSAHLSQILRSDLKGLQTKFPQDVVFDKNPMYSLPANALYVLKKRIEDNTHQNVKKGILNRLSFLEKRRLVHMAILRQIKAKFDFEKIDFILLKGLAIELKAYGFTPRFSEDIDLLINERDLKRVKSTLAKLRFKPVVISKMTKPWKNLKNQYSFSNKDLFDAYLDVHTAIFDSASPFLLSNAFLFRNSQKINVSNTTVSVLNNELLIMHLCLQLSYTDAFRNYPLTCYELAKFLKNNKINWEKFVKLCCESNSSAFVFASFTLVEREMQCCVVPKNTLLKLKYQSRRAQLRLLLAFLRNVDFNSNNVLTRSILKLSIALITGRTFKRLILLFDALIQFINVRVVPKGKQ